MILKNKFNTILLILLGSCLLSSCYKAPEGCIDPRASNYNVKADKSCENECCSYPDIDLNVTFKYGEDIIDTSTVISHNNLNILKINKLVFYLSEFTFLQGVENEASITDKQITIGQYSASGISYSLADFSVAKVKMASGTTHIHNLGTFKNADLYSRLALNFGLKDEVNHAELSKLNTSNPLYKSQDSMYISLDEGFYYLKLNLSINEHIEKSIYIKGDNYFNQLQFDSTFDFRERETRNINLAIDLAEWFKNINFESNEIEEIENLLLINMKNAFIFD